MEAEKIRDFLIRSRTREMIEQFPTCSDVLTFLFTVFYCIGVVQRYEERHLRYA